MEHRLSRDSLEKRLRYRGFPFKRLHYSTPPQEFFRRLREEEVATCEFASECRDVRYNFAPTLANICITADHFHIDPLADLFTEHVRLSSHVKGCPSPLKMWHKYVRNELPRRALTDLAMELYEAGSRKHVPVTDCASFYLREALFLLSRECTQFKATLSKAAHQLCAQQLGVPPQTLRVLDPCTGWGDRLAGALSLSVASYTGVDPNPLLLPGHQALASVLSQGTKCQFIQKPFEDVSPQELGEPFDLIFTSPPFSSFELYCTGLKPDTLQSSSRHADHQWAQNWLLPAASKMVTLLRPGGLLALYLSDTKVGLHCELLLGHMKQEPVEFQGIVWCCRHDRSRPLWIWRKAGEAQPTRRPMLFSCEASAFKPAPVVEDALREKP